jgi:hypothetical protein
MPKEHHQANLGELCSCPEPVPDVAASKHVQDMGGTAQNGCSKTTPHKLISRYQTKPTQWKQQNEADNQAAGRRQNMQAGQGLDRNAH